MATIFPRLLLVPSKERTYTRIADHAYQVQCVIGYGHALLLIAIRNIFAGAENLDSGFGRFVEPLLNLVFSKLLLQLGLPMETNDLLARQTHQRIASPQRVIEKRECMIFGQRHQPQR